MNKNIFLIEIFMLSGLWMLFSCGDTVSNDSAILNGSVDPNPASKFAALMFQCPRSSLAEINILDNSDRIISEIFSGMMNAGQQKKRLVVWNLPSGVYKIKILIGDYVQIIPFAVVH